MRRLVILVIGSCLIAFAVQWAVIKYMPNIVYKIAISRIDHKSNIWIHAGNTDANMRRVVMPNPDFVYSALFYDVHSKPITISGVLPDSTYASVSFYDDRCQPYYVYNNLDSTRTGKFELNLGVNNAQGGHAVHALTERGVIICRFLKSTDSSYRQLVPYQQTLKAN